MIRDKKAMNDHTLERMDIPDQVMQVVSQLHKAGHKALLAGGCVRDMLLGREAWDYDVATDAVPEVVSKLFRRTLMVGAQFGVVVVMVGDYQVEVATFRSDVSYEDGRRPEKVVFTDAQHDAQRRDFTINGMFYDPIAHEVVDYVNGRSDLKAGIVRAIGVADDRFEEDHLRMLRAIRFASRLSFSIESETWTAIVKHARQIERISAERVIAELEKILVDRNRSRGARMGIDSGLFELIFKGVTAEQLESGVKVLGCMPVECDFSLGLAGLLVDCKVGGVEKLCRQLKASNEVRKQVGWLIGCREKLYDAIPMSKGHLKLWMAEPLFEMLVELNRAVLAARGVVNDKLLELGKLIEQLGDEPVSPERLLNGHELMELGAVPGPMMGKLSNAVYLAQLEGDIQDVDQARQWVRRWLEDC